jgi:hypothetical protein
MKNLRSILSLLCLLILVPQPSFSETTTQAAPEFQPGTSGTFYADAGTPFERKFWVRDPDGGSVYATMTGSDAAGPLLSSGGSSGPRSDYLVRWNPPANAAAKTYSLKFTATDNERQTKEMTMTVVLRPRPTQAPEFQSGTSGTFYADVGTPFERKFWVRDPDGGSIYASMPATEQGGPTLSNSGGGAARKEYVIRLNAGLNAPGKTYTLKITAKDDENQTKDMTSCGRARHRRPNSNPAPAARTMPMRASFLKGNFGCATPTAETYMLR